MVCAVWFYLLACLFGFVFLNRSLNLMFVYAKYSERFLMVEFPSALSSSTPLRLNYWISRSRETHTHLHTQTYEVFYILNIYHDWSLKSIKFVFIYAWIEFICKRRLNLKLKIISISHSVLKNNMEYFRGRSRLFLIYLFLLLFLSCFISVVFIHPFDISI